MRYIDSSKTLDVPESVATCPECGNQIYLEVTEHETETGQITDGGFEMYCPKYDIVEEHGGSPLAWQPTEAKVYKWLCDNIRVADATEDKLSAWMEAVKEWQISEVSR